FIGALAPMRGIVSEGRHWRNFERLVNTDEIVIQETQLVFETAVIPLVQSDDHHVQANLPAAKTTTHTIRNRNIETAKLACFLNSLRPSLIRVVRRKKIERTKRTIGIAAAR